MIDNLNEYTFDELREIGNIFNLYTSKKLTKIAYNVFSELTQIDVNKYSGIAYAVDEDYNIIAENNGKLDLFICLPSGIEGFYDELHIDPEIVDDDDIKSLIVLQQYT